MITTTINQNRGLTDSLSYPTIEIPGCPITYWKSRAKENTSWTDKKLRPQPTKMNKTLKRFINNTLSSIENKWNYNVIDDCMDVELSSKHQENKSVHKNPLKPHFYIVKLGFAGVYLFFLFLLQNIDCGYSLEPTRRGGSNVYPQSMFWVKIRKISNIFDWKFSIFTGEKISVYVMGKFS